MTWPEHSRPLDVVIAGAGLAGGSLALRLARTGARVALLDSAQFPRDKLCGEFLSPECWRVLNDLGLAGAVGHQGYHAIRRVRITTQRGPLLDVEVIGNDGLPGIGLSRSVLDDLIVRHARAAGVEVIEGARVGSPIVQEGRVSGVAARRLDGASFEVRATVTVAADGRHSGLVQRTGTTRVRSRFRPRFFGLKRHWVVTGSDAEPVGTVGLHLVPGGYAGTCRIEAPLTNLCDFATRVGPPPSSREPRSPGRRPLRSEPGAGPDLGCGDPVGRMEDRRRCPRRGLIPPHGRHLLRR